MRKSLMNMKSKRKPAFTLIEILAASAIMTVIVLAVLSVTTTILSTWNRSSGQLKNYFDANVVMSVIQEDLEGIKIKRDGRAWLEVSYPEEIGFLRGADYKGTIPLKPPCVMFYSSTLLRPRYSRENLQTAIAENDQPVKLIPGSVCAVKYSIGLKSPFLKAAASRSENERQINAFYGFYRAVIDPRSTALEASGNLVQGYSKDVDSQSYKFALSNNLWSKICTIVDEEGVERQGQDLRTWALDPENLLAQNVVDFRISFGVLYPDTSSDQPDAKRLAIIPPGVAFTAGRKILFDTATAKAFEFGGAGGTTEVDTAELEDGTLAFADISMTVVSEAGAREMRALMTSKRMTEELFKEMVLRHGSTVTRRIHFIEPMWE